MSKKLQIIALFISVIGLLVFSSCTIVDGITGNDKKDETVSLHPVLLNGKWGFINNNGAVVISPEFDEAREFSDGYAAVRNGTTWGYLSEETTELAIATTFSVAGNFSNGLAPAQIPGGLYGFINTSGEFQINPQFDFASSFSEELAAVRADGLWGYVSTNGEIVISPSFSDARSFSESLAAVETFEGWVYIDKTGTEVISPSFQVTNAGEFSDGLAAIQTTNGWGFINQTGSPVITPEFVEVGQFSQGLAFVREDNYIGFINTTGALVIPYQFAEVKAFNENMAAVRLSSRWFYIDRDKGRLVVSTPFNAAECYSNGIARVQLGEDENSHFGYIDTNGEYIWYPTR